MLPLQLNKLGLHKKITIITKLIILSFFFHCIILVMFFFLSMRRHRLNINNIDLDNADIVLMPLTKHINKQTKEVPKAITQKREQITTIKQQKTEKKSPQTSLVKKAPKKQQIPKKKNEDQKKTQPKKNKVSKKTTPSKKTATSSNRTQPQPTVVGRHDLDLLQQAQRVKEAIRASWSRPTGLSKNCEYHAIIRVNSVGRAEMIRETPSGALALDMSARNFIVQFSFPKQLAQYEIEIVL